jgi:hypothetical protein
MSRLYEDDYADEANDYDYEEEEDGTSAEDQARMRQGVVQVREVLGEGAKSVTQQQIEDALWHYYYDVDKSVNYLLNKFIAPPEKTPKKNAKKATENGKSLFSVTLLIQDMEVALRKGLRGMLEASYSRHANTSQTSILACIRG